MMSTEAPYESLRPLMKVAGANCTPKEFYWKVNEAFHAAEAGVYDERHLEMYKSAELLWGRLLKQMKTREPVKVLDVGCGTGLVGTVLNRLCCDRVSCMTAVDPSRPMLRRLVQKARTWGFPIETVQGTLETVPAKPEYGMVTVSSVLHHVVELEPFCNRLLRVMAPGCLLFTLQDPRAEAQSDSVLADRRKVVKARLSRSRTIFGRLRGLAGRPLRRLGLRQGDPLERATNAVLLEAGTIRYPLELRMIWAVTDFHVPGQPGRLGNGIAQDSLRSWLAGIELVDYFTYQFHDFPQTMLSPEELEQEARWWTASDEHGALFGSAWRVPA